MKLNCVEPCVGRLLPCKTFPPEAIREASAAGIRVFGENRVQEFVGKVEALRDSGDAEWHLIGHLQSNKAARAAELFAAVDSLDSVKLADKLDAAVGIAAEKDAASRVSTGKRVPRPSSTPGRCCLPTRGSRSC